MMDETCCETATTSNLQLDSVKYMQVITVILENSENLAIKLSNKSAYSKFIISLLLNHGAFRLKSGFLSCV